MTWRIIGFKVYLTNITTNNHHQKPSIMNIVVISKREGRLFFGSEESPQGFKGLKIDFVRGKKKNTQRILEINTPEEFQQACSTAKKTSGSRSGQEKKTINGFLSSGDYNENQVFIVPEGWGDSVDKGYEMACKLLNSVGKVKPFNLRFVSQFTREQLLKRVKKENKTLVETFPHLCFFDRTVQITPEAYSTAHFKLIRDIAVSDSGRLSLIRHEVKNIVEEKLDASHLDEAAKRFKQHALAILDDLDGTAYHNCYDGCQQKLDALRKRVDAITQTDSVDEFKNASVKLQNDILELIQDISIRLPRTNPQGNSPNVKKKYRVLIIEDSRDQRRSLYHFFSDHYEFVACNDLGDTLDEVAYAEWEKRLETTYFGADLRKKESVERIIKGIESRKTLKYDQIQPLNDKLEKILQGSNNKVLKHLEKISQYIGELQGKPTINKKELQSLVVELKHILDELDKSFQTEKAKNIKAISTITLEDYGPASEWIGNIKELGGMFDIVILDLLLKRKDGETWLPFNGIDLLCCIRKNIPYNTVRIITSLPRHEVGSILREEGVVVPMNQIFTKGNGWPQLEGCLYDRMDEIDTECEENEERRRAAEEICMPNNGEFFSHSEVREYVQKLIETGAFQGVFEKAQSLVNSNTLNIKLMGKHGFKKDKVEQLFVNYLAHRYAFLNWAATAGSQVTMQGINFTNYADKAKTQYHIDRDVKDKGYYISIGFSTSGDCCVNLDAERMFPEELDYYLQHMSSPSVAIPDVVLKWCVCVVRPLLSKNAEVCGNVKFMSFCTAIDNKMLAMDDLFGLLDECILYSNIKKEFKELLEVICQQKWFNKKMPSVIEELKKYEELKSLPSHVGSVVESYTNIQTNTLP